MATTWSASTSLSVGNIIAPTSASAGLFFKVTVAGTTGSSEPSWATSIGETVYDNDVRYVSFSATFNDLQPINPSAIIELFTLKLDNTLHGATTVYRFHAGSNMNLNGKIVVGDINLEEDEYELESKIVNDDSSQIVVGENIIVSLDINLDEVLIGEGISRDVIRLIQNLRREKNLDVSDNIDIKINADKAVTKAIQDNYSYVCTQVLANKIELGNDIDNNSEKISGHSISINIK